jgi:hypothetical protein
MKRIALAFALLVACAKPEPPAPPAAPATPPPPTAQQARDLIAPSAEFGDFEFTNAGFTLPTSGAMMNEPAKIAARELAKAGWLELHANGDVALAAKARSDKRFLLRPNGLLDIVPLAKKEMGAVTAVHLPFVDFTWRWIPNEVGASFKTGVVHDRFAAEHHARATLMWDGSSWTVLKIEDAG